MPPPNPSPPADATRFAAARAQFVSDWRAGCKPRIEDALASADPADREALFRTLLTAELELRAKASESLGTAAYKARFPEFAAGPGHIMGLSVKSSGRSCMWSRSRPQRSGRTSTRSYRTSA